MRHLLALFTIRLSVEIRQVLAFLSVLGPTYIDNELLVKHHITLMEYFHRFLQTCGIQCNGTSIKV